VEVLLHGETAFFLLAPTAGGLVLELGGAEITLLTPASGLYRKLVGLRVGAVLDSPPLRVVALS
jgi:hypothetical protein